MKAFGVGCLWFSLKNKNQHDYLDVDFDKDDFINVLRKNLEKIPVISDINIEFASSSDLRYSSYEISDSNYEYNFFPLLYPFDIKFQITIPKRIQDDILLRESSIEAEKFDFWLRNTMDNPVVIISYDTDQIHARPSSAIIVVRKFLAQYLDNNSAEICLKTLGPSPFHADFYIKSDEKMKETSDIMEMIDVSSPGIGYDDYLFSYNPEYVKTDNDALNTIMDVYCDSISTYYKSVLFRYERMYLGLEIQNHIDQLIQMQTATGFGAIFKRMISSPRISRDIMISLLRNEMKKIEIEAFLKEAKNRRSLLPNTGFEKSVDREISHHDIAPASDIRHIVQLFEERYLKNIENSTVLVAGLIGGLVGSVLTYLLGR